MHIWSMVCCTALKRNKFCFTVRLIRIDQFISLLVLFHLTLCYFLLLFVLFKHNVLLLSIDKVDYCIVDYKLPFDPKITTFTCAL